MKLKIKAITNQNVCIDTFTYPPFSSIECELDTKHIPTYSKAFETWEIIDPVVSILNKNDIKVKDAETENVDGKEYNKETTVKHYGKGATKAKS